MATFITLENLTLDKEYLVIQRYKYFYNGDYSFIIKVRKIEDSSEYHIKIERDNQIFTRLIIDRNDQFRIKRTTLDIGTTTITINTIVEDEGWLTLNVV